MAAIQFKRVFAYMYKVIFRTLHFRMYYYINDHYLNFKKIQGCFQITDTLVCAYLWVGTGLCTACLLHVLDIKFMLFL